MKKEKTDLELLKLTIESREFKIKTLIEENDYWRWEAKRLKEELEETKNDLEHRDSFFSIMRDVLANDDLTDEDIAEILYAVVHFECGDEKLSKRNVEIAEKFWFRDYV